MLRQSIDAMGMNQMGLRLTNAQHHLAIAEWPQGFFGGCTIFLSEQTSERHSVRHRKI